MKKALILAVILLPVLAFAQGVPFLNFTSVINSGLSSPVDVVNAGDGTNRIFIVQRGGTVRVYNSSYTLLNANFLTISTNFTTGGERGLLSMVFHPDYENNRYFFVYYTNGAGGVNIDRFQTQAGNPNAADAATRTTIMSIPKPYVFTNHNGGKLNFGPDGNLYFGLGDSGSGGDPYNFSQRGDSLWGKLVRINVDDFSTPPYYTIPLDNPYNSDPAILDEIYNFGLRNPWRWSFDRLTNDFWIADVGQGAREEVNFVPFPSASAKNYGWRCYEGNNSYNPTGCQPASAYQFPIFDYPHNNATGGFSITGGYVYRGSLYPLLYGYYVCADYVSGNEWLINQTSPGVFSSYIQTGLPGSIAGFGETETGELFALSLNGTLYTVGALTVVPVKINAFTAKRNGNIVALEWKAENETNLIGYQIQYSTDGVQYTNAGFVNAKNVSAAAYTFMHNPQSNGALHYRLAIQNKDGSLEYSSILFIAPENKLKPAVITNISAESITLGIDKDIVALRIYTTDGKLVNAVNTLNNSGTHTIKSNFTSNIYFIKAISRLGSIYTVKFMPPK